MTELTLEWIEGGVSRSEQIQPNQPSKHPGTVRIGRDPQRCDIVLSDSSVSGLQAEVYYHAGSQVFFLRSLRESNPPIVNGQPIPKGEVPLGNASTLTLGRVVFNVRASTVSGGLPPTEVSPQRGAPPTPPTQVTAPPPGNPPPYPAASPAPYHQSQPTADSGPQIWVWIIAGVLVLGGGALAWPFISTFLGLNQDPSVSQTESRDNADANSSEDSFGNKMADLATYTHPSGLFRIDVPRTWERTDTSKAGEVILRWTDRDTGSGVVVDLFQSRQRFSQRELGNLARQLITNAFEDRPNFRTDAPRRRNNGVVELSWTFSTGNDQVLGATFTQQRRNTVSVVSIYVLQSDFKQVESTFQEILSSYQFDPAVDIP
ncbi:FHA domain-containing protein [Acaryochloris sp. IP29b_bin.148]|uniref:FHA domain-containing protein n=1 Tax=Acaryochloris sp. IP29b_bin.148 TaxID=2969218 RepID=UPI0026394A01|nr:FHA domain-containing protein [Acaryochloris sp. IP29b_bin.148]